MTETKPSRSPRAPAPVLTLVALTLVAACATDDAASPAPRCRNHDPDRAPFFGDLHVHTRLSADAAIFGVTADPHDAYRFARGEPLALASPDGRERPTARLRRPLDFAAVTDHSEFLAETEVCTDPEAFGYDSVSCQLYRPTDDNEGFPLVGFVSMAIFIALPQAFAPPLCTLRPEVCRAAEDRVWGIVLDAAEAHQDRTDACSFTTFVAYEYTGTTMIANLHRNVIFRGDQVPPTPVSYFDAPTPDRLWEELDAACTDAGTGCEVLAIPHNSNLAGGTMFDPTTEDGAPYTAEEAARRARLEPLFEMVQHKGASECTPARDPLGSTDELCGFELIGPVPCTGPGEPEGCMPLCSDLPTGALGAFVGQCIDPGDFARGALRTGLAENRRTGANPFRFGFIGSTDTHNGIAGATAEDGFVGHGGVSDDDVEERLGAFLEEGEGGALQEALPIPDIAKRYSPGGLAVLWAEENTRESLFDAMQRREAYATSGPRIVARMFGGWDYPGDLCDRPDLVSAGYTKGVPMGGDLPARASSASAPVFVVSALADAGVPEAPGTPLERIQIVKGWLDPAGQTHERVVDVAGSADPDAGVDLDTCEPPETGVSSLCAVWSDPDFDPSEPAFYYARIVESPTCRWSRRDCLAAGVDCAVVPADSPMAACCDGSLPDTIQERAWTSPIWYTP